MTVVLLICTVPPIGSPFVMIAADSRATDSDGEVLTNNAKKIFDAGNAYMSTSGAANQEFREEVAKFLKEQPEGTIEEKMHVLQQILGEGKRDFNLQMNVGLVQFDSIGNPQMGLCSVNPEGEDAVLGPYTYDKNEPYIDHLYFGEPVTEEIDKLRDELTNRIVAGKINRTSVEEAAKWFIREVAKIYPQTVNGVIQTKTMRFK